MTEIIRHLFRRKIRTSLTILAVAVGIFAVVTVGGIAERLESVVQGAYSSEANRVTLMPEKWDRPLTEAVVRELRRVEGVAGVVVTVSDLLAEPEESQVRIYFNPETFSGTRSDIPGLEYEPPMGVKLWAGRTPAPGSRAEIVVSWDIAQKYDLDVGDIFTVRGRPFRVVGIWEYTAGFSLRNIYMLYDMALELATPNPFRGIGTVMVVARPGVDLEELATRIEAEVEGVQAMSPREAVNQTRQQVLIFSLIVGASGVLALLIGSFTIINTMIVSVHERRREIGLKKALGAADSHILAEVVAEAAVIGGMGGLVGVAASLATTMFVNRAFSEPLGMELFLVTPRLGVGAVVFTVLMGVVAGVYPAWQAARLDPVVALRGGGGAVYAERGLRRLLYLIRRNARSILTVGSIAIGIFSLVVLGSLAEYLNGFLDRAIEGSRDKVGVQPKDTNVPFGRATMQVIRRVPGVREVVLTGNGGTIDEEQSIFEMGEYFYGVESPTGEYGFDMPMEVKFAAGRNLTPGSLDEVVVGASLAENHNLKVGDTFTIRERDFTVVGVWERIPQDISGFNSRAYVSLDAASLALKEKATIQLMTALLEPGYEPQAVARAIEAELPGVETMTAEEQAAEIRQIFTVLIGVMAGLLSIAVFVGSVSVVNTMIIAVHERTAEIGLKKAVGAGDGDILAEVLADAGKLGGLGGALGVLAAWPVTWIINVVAQRSADFTIMSLTPRLAVGSVIFSVLLGMAAGVFPAWRAARLDPVEALRTE